MYSGSSVAWNECSRCEMVSRCREIDSIGNSDNWKSGGRKRDWLRRNKQWSMSNTNTILHCFHWDKTWIFRIQSDLHTIAKRQNMIFGILWISIKWNLIAVISDLLNDRYCWIVSDWITWRMAGCFLYLWFDYSLSISQEREMTRKKHLQSEREKKKEWQMEWDHLRSKNEWDEESTRKMYSKQKLSFTIPLSNPFFCSGVLGILLCLLWWTVVVDSPEECPSLSPAERNLLIGPATMRPNGKKPVSSRERERGKERELTSNASFPSETSLVSDPLFSRRMVYFPLCILSQFRGSCLLFISSILLQDSS